MQIVNNVKETMNYGIISTVQLTNKMASNPKVFKKANKLVTAFVRGLDYCTGLSHIPVLLEQFNGANQFIDIYGSFRNLVYWIGPFETKRVDQTLFAHSLEEAIRTHMPKSTKTSPSIDSIVKRVIEKGESAKNKNELCKILKETLRKEGWSGKKAGKISGQVTLILKPRPLVQKISMMFSTVSDLGDNLGTFDKWKLIDLAQIAEKIGTQYPALKVVMFIPLKTAVNALSCVALAINLTTATIELIKIQRNIGQATDASLKANLYRERSEVLWSWTETGSDLALNGLPMVMVLSPPVMIGMAIFAKGTGFLNIMRK